MQVLLLSCRISVERQVNFIKSFEKLIVLLFAGSAHIHGVLFLDLDKIVDNEVKKGMKIWEFLQSALRKCRDGEIPSEDEENAISLFVNKFITCSLFQPRSRKIAREVQ